MYYSYKTQSIHIPVEYQQAQSVVNFLPKTVLGLLHRCIPIHCIKIKKKNSCSMKYPYTAEKHLTTKREESLHLPS